MHPLQSPKLAHLPQIQAATTVARGAHHGTRRAEKVRRARNDTQRRACSYPTQSNDTNEVAAAVAKTTSRG